MSSSLEIGRRQEGFLLAILSPPPAADLASLERFKYGAGLPVHTSCSSIRSGRLPISALLQQRGARAVSPSTTINMQMGSLRRPGKEPVRHLGLHHGSRSALLRGSTASERSASRFGIGS